MFWFFSHSKKSQLSTFFLFTDFSRYFHPSPSPIPWSNDIEKNYFIVSSKNAWKWCSRPSRGGYLTCSWCLNASMLQRLGEKCWWSVMGLFFWCFFFDDFFKWCLVELWNKVVGSQCRISVPNIPLLIYTICTSFAHLLPWWMVHEGIWGWFARVEAPKIVSSSGSMVGICTIWPWCSFSICQSKHLPLSKNKNATLIAFFFFAVVFSNDPFWKVFIMNSAFEYFWTEKTKHTHIFLKKRYIHIYIYTYMAQYMKFFFSPTFCDGHKKFQIAQRGFFSWTIQPTTPNAGGQGK